MQHAGTLLAAQRADGHGGPCLWIWRCFFSFNLLCAGIHFCETFVTHASQTQLPLRMQGILLQELS